ncbi:MAG: bifunctional phosphoribosyl-AMP cyclohydrolase/phosphoribosyl-ATP diphosphatase HisIE [Rhodothermales bacterium]
MTMPSPSDAEQPLVPLLPKGRVPVFDERGLIPAVVQDFKTNRVLMLAWMSEESLQVTRTSGHVTFFSRSRQQLWEKGETSGNTLCVEELRLDCDGDTLLVKVHPMGPTCHTGADTCWEEDNHSIEHFIPTLERIIDLRAEVADTESSYTSRLLKAGPKKIAQKVGEEGVEVALEGATGNEERLLEESADLMYHLLVLLKASGLSFKDVEQVLASRHG